MFADLHIHSWYSDGKLSPEEIVEKAKSQNITLISICDHELIDAYPEMYKLCADNNIDLIAGVEIIAVMDSADYHILAYGFDIQDKGLNELLSYNRGILADMGIKLIEKISEDYASVSIEEFSKYERNRKNGGWESIDYLKSKGLVNNVRDYFGFLAKYDSPPNKDFISAAEVIKIIHDAGGYAVLAHPGEYTGQNLETCEKIAVKFMEIGINGFECYYPNHTVEITDFFVKLCREYDFIITTGGDEHGGFNNERYHIGAVKIRIEQLNLKNLLKTKKGLI
ncbi:MAG: PHP domain-containing protein [Oscillospiraceae bacterium]|nr:PHP domain-containing protein [Oscillospiraceae bacterium]